MPAIIVSPNLATTPMASNTAFDHASYLATVEDIFGLGRLTTTESATPMSEFFKPAPAGTTAQ
jgi:hypothetical protein